MTDDGDACGAVWTVTLARQTFRRMMIRWFKAGSGLLAQRLRRGLSVPCPRSKDD
jgi:hypothetical protein